MTVIPAGSFQMGEEGKSDETPVHPVTIARPFAISQSVVTFDQYDACAQDGGCGRWHPNDFGWGRADRPVVNVSWYDASDYIIWLSRKTGHKYRLPSEAELEYAVRGGTTTKFWWGDDFIPTQANCERCSSAFASRMTAPVCSLPKNRFGLCDAVGNVSVWVEDRWNPDYKGAPADGSAWEDGDLHRRVLRGGSWFNGKGFLHSAYRNGDAPEVHNAKLGFRVVRDL